MKKLLIVESPAKAKTIGKYLGKDFQVLASYGHVRSIPSRNHAVRPEMNFEIDYEVISKTDRNKKQNKDSKEKDKKVEKKGKKDSASPSQETEKKLDRHLEEIANAAKKSDAIYLAPDPDREGEAISWHIRELLKQHNALKDNVPVHRVAFHSITKKAIEEAIKNPREIDMNLVRAQQTRQALDYLVGFTISPILWRKLPGSKSAGRVQSVALRLLCDREAEIRAFISKEYWSIFLECQKDGTNFKAGLAEYRGEKLGKHDIGSQEQANEMLAYLNQQSFAISSVEKKQSKKSPSPPFTTSTMLQDASRKLGYSAAKTSKLAQKLYEGVNIDGQPIGIITYMRTDSVMISSDAIDQIRSLVNTKFGKKYLPDSNRIFKTKSKNAQEAHEAIRPTNPDFTPEYVRSFLENDHFRLYELIWRRAVASQMADALFDNTLCKITDNNKGDCLFRVNGRVTLFKGFYEVYDDSEEGTKGEESDLQKLPKLTEGDALAVEKITPTQHFTQAPPRYNEASLVKKMEELGIGRPSTYATIISILQQRSYAKLESKRFFAEDRGELVNAFLVNFFNKYVQYDFTANLEDELDSIACGEIDQIATLSNFWQPFKNQSNEVMGLPTESILHNIEDYLADYIFEKGEKKCPICKEGNLNLRNGKFGSYISCSRYPDCSYKRKMHEASEASEDGEGSEPRNPSMFPKDLGDTENGTVFLNVGPYGPYFRVMKDNKQVKITSLPKGIALDSADLNLAERVLSLPKEIGKYNGSIILR